MLKYWLKLWFTKGVGPKLFNSLFSQASEISELFEDSFIKHKVQSKLPVNINKQLFNNDFSSAEQALEWQAKKTHHHIITLTDAAYPETLKALPDAPPLLFIKGNLQLLSSPQIAIVGSRNASQYGLDNAFQFAKALTECGLCVTSGLARGIDGFAHQGALHANGHTLAVLGSGLERLYPKEHHKLAKDILAQAGTLVSEYPLELSASRTTFPRRNRLISGLASGVLVVEAAQKSGSLITARYALEQGREVFAIPGSIHSPRSKGCHELIRSGEAKLVETANDILIECASHWNNLDIQENQSEINTTALSSAQQNLLACLNGDMMPIDQLIAESGLSASEVSSMLLVLELEGWVKSVPGGYVSVRPT